MRQNPERWKKEKGPTKGKRDGGPDSLNDPQRMQWPRPRRPIIFQGRFISDCKHDVMMSVEMKGSLEFLKCNRVHSTTLMISQGPFFATEAEVLEWLHQGRPPMGGEKRCKLFLGSRSRILFSPFLQQVFDTNKTGHGEYIFAPPSECGYLIIQRCARLEAAAALILRLAGTPVVDLSWNFVAKIELAPGRCHTSSRGLELT